MVQTVKAICATLNRVETVEIIRAVRRLRSITLERVRISRVCSIEPLSRRSHIRSCVVTFAFVLQTLQPASPANRDAFVYVTPDGDSAGSVVDSEVKR